VRFDPEGSGSIPKAAASSPYSRCGGRRCGCAGFWSGSGGGGPGGGGLGGGAVC